MPQIYSRKPQQPLVNKPTSNFPGLQKEQEKQIAEYVKTRFPELETPQQRFAKAKEVYTSLYLNEGKPQGQVVSSDKFDRVQSSRDFNQKSSLQQFLNPTKAAIANIPNQAGNIASFGIKAGRRMGENMFGIPSQVYDIADTKGLSDTLQSAGERGQKVMQDAMGVDPNHISTKGGEFVGDVAVSLMGSNQNIPMSVKNLGQLGVRGGLEGAKYSIAQEGNIDPGEVGFGAVAEMAVPIVGLGAKFVNKMVGNVSARVGVSALDDVSKALRPTKKKMKQLTEKIAPEFLEKGIRGSRESMLKLAQKNAKKFGSMIDEFVDAGKLDDITIPLDSVKKVLHEAKLGTMVGDKVVNKTKFAVADGIDEVLSQFGREVTGREARAIRQILDEVVYSTKGGIQIEDLTYKNVITKEVADTLRKEISKASPDLAKLNKEFSFYKTLSDVLTETIERMKPQSRGLRKMTSTAVGAMQDGSIIEKAFGYIASKAFLDTTSSATWNTISAQLKYKLSKALASGSSKAVNKVVQEINQKHNTKLPMYDEVIDMGPQQFNKVDNSMYSKGNPMDNPFTTKTTNNPMQVRGVSNDVGGVVGLNEAVTKTPDELLKKQTGVVKNVRLKDLLDFQDWGNRQIVDYDLVNSLENGYDTTNPIDFWIFPDGKAVVADGNGRMLAAKELGMESIPVRITKVDLDSKFFSAKPFGAVDNVAGKLDNIPDDLLQEARKYDSADEFLEQFEYHGGPEEIKGGKLERLMADGGDMGGVFTTKDRDYANIYANNYLGKGKLHRVYVGDKKIIDLTSKEGIQKMKDFIGKTYKNNDGELVKFTQQDFDFLFPTKDGADRGAYDYHGVVEEMGFDGARILERSDYKGRKVTSTVFNEGGLKVYDEEQLRKIREQANNSLQ